MLRIPEPAPRNVFGGPIVLAVCTMLAACGGAAGPAPSAGQLAPAGSSAAAESPKASTSSASPAPAAGSAGPVSSAAALPIKIGVLDALTGQNATSGKENVDGTRLYLDSVNNTLGGRKVEVIVADTVAQADVALTKAKQLVENDKVNVLMGFGLTPECYAVAGYVKQVHVPMIISDNCGAQGLTTNPKFASPYIVRTTFSSFETDWTLADWTYKQGRHKAILMLSDYGGGLEITDEFASAFVRRGGSIVQEIHPPLGTTDFGPYLAGLNKTADVLVEFSPGTDGLRFGEQYQNYIGNRKLPVEVIASVVTRGANLAGLKDKAIGLVNSDIYTQALDTPANKRFLQLFKAKYPNSVPSVDHVGGYVGAQVLQAAVEKVHGNIEQTQQFLDALYATNLDTAKGPLKLDKYHDALENGYIYEMVKQDGGVGVGEKLLQTYPNLTQFGDLTEQESLRFPWGTLKGQWVGMTKEKLATVAKQPG